MSDTAGITLSMDQGARRRGHEPRPQPVLILALECHRPRALSTRHALGGVRAVHLGRGDRRAATRSGAAPARQLAVHIPDPWMSSRHARIEHSYGRWVLSDAGSKNGTVVNGAPVDRAELRDGDVVELGHTVLVFRDALPLAPGEPEDLDLALGPPGPPGLLTLDPDHARELRSLRQVAGASVPVLLRGETGTGKEVLARAVHALSGRPGAFVAVNCGAIPAHLVESELFGHRRGAFSGAVEHREGLVRASSRGTLFLDEIGDLPAASQAALLRVLQEHEVLPVGASKPVPVDLRVVAATHRDLDAMAAAGDFRGDLLARLGGFCLTVPPLRARRDDLGLLIGAIFDRLARDLAAGGDPASPGTGAGPTLDVAAARRMFAHAWPFNVRELQQALATAVVLAGAGPIALEHLPEAVRRDPPAPAPPRPAGAPAAAALRPGDAALRHALATEMRAQRGNVSAVARAMGKDRKQIQRWLERFGLRAEEFRR